MSENVKKKKTLKWIGITVGAVVAVLVVLYFCLNMIVAYSIETVGPKVAGVKMNVGAIYINLLNGSVLVKNMEIGNPEGYGTPNAIMIGNAYVDIDPLSVFRNKFVVQEITVKDVNVNFETNLLSSNLTDIKKNLDKLAPQSKAKPEEEPTAESKSEEAAPAKKLEVDKIDFANITVSVSMKGSDAGAPIPVPPFYVEKLGTGPDGATIGEISGAVLTGLIDGIGKATTNAIPTESLKEKIRSMF